MLPCLEVKYWTPIHMKSSSGLTTESSYQSTEAFWFTFCSLPLLCPSAGRYLGIKCSWSDCWCHSHILSSSIASGRSGIPAPKVRAHGFLLLHQGKTRSPQPGAVTQKQPQTSRLQSKPLQHKTRQQIRPKSHQIQHLATLVVRWGAVHHRTIIIHCFFSTSDFAFGSSFFP